MVPQLAPCHAQCVLEQNCFYPVAFPPSQSDHLLRPPEPHQHAAGIGNHFRTLGQLFYPVPPQPHPKPPVYFPGHKRSCYKVRGEYSIVGPLQEKEQELISHQRVNGQHSTLTERRCGQMNQGEEWEFLGCLEAEKNLCRADGVEQCVYLQSIALTNSKVECVCSALPGSRMMFSLVL